ncbi:TetR/AcrR family transcriptional regulator [Actinomadura madurae]|uniref:TetR/AcrR family transcriptional regulator n=1 Tax=Actinomadura madurae TaxID=1993 RepID=UPI00202611BC|nr:TetR/AcrR family transcriptional regulator [Actinomadura madurae]MCP9951456.1 TetR/AcrR family transcriptional regulator [Actinomadura madurae]MCP9968231.1 TetR/AcrR family transcriptional regulator [Actinomadura madurae]MCP9980689.1 TetR/AcrR family transcriptional regulator [Actinomadura madurae]MCQ0007802.1 TetR/AcrR family transcriptional regulator [Actinomadura madurae]MCQ0016888.1 TetR/AcrR family transcriptional regulator [Actinomadura madurae]
MAVRRERADAARNRRAILQATETLLAEHRPSDVSIERVAAKAGVSKGTVFHRFGSRTGLMVELMKERAAGLQEAVTQGAPPLGPGAPAGERLLAFLSAVVEVVGRNKGLLAALGGAVTPPRDGGDRPVYRFWHGHVSTLLAEARPDLEAEVVADLLLACLHAEPTLRMLERGEGERVAFALRALAVGLVGE